MPADLQRRYAWDEARGIDLALAIHYRGEVLPQWRHKTVTNPFYGWWWLLAGRVQVEAVGERFSASEGEWILIPCGLRREQLFSEDARIISINFSARWRSGVPILQLPRPLVQRGAEAMKCAAQAVVMDAVDGDGGDRGHPSLGQRALSLEESLDLTSALARFAKGVIRAAVECGEGHISEAVVSDGRLERVLWDLQTALQAGPLPFPRWEEQTGLSRVQLDRICRARLGVSLHRYRDRLLITEACRRLGAQEAVKQIAFDLGFVDSSHFCRWVRRHTGRAPTELALGQF